MERGRWVGGVGGRAGLVARWGRGWAGQGRWWVGEWGDENGLYFKSCYFRDGHKGKLVWANILKFGTMCSFPRYPPHESPPP